ncbi:hypothetical protein JW826_03770 [Candidatus Woesearchaeota archaeon]|nr:hypothetical protein [Candidatus Woesearchaeota archaeon]
MGIVMPDSMDDCIYFTRRVFDNNGKAIAWVKRKPCPKCKKGEMGKPLDPKTKRPKIRADTYECPECRFSEEKIPHEESLLVEVLYTCPFCGHKGEATTPYKRVNWDGVKAYVFACEACKKKIGITKKMKSGKSTGKGGSDDDDDE